MAAPAFPAAVHNHTNEAFANFQRYELFRDDPDYTSWSIVFLFYSALHLVEAHHRAYNPAITINAHKDRNNYVAHYINPINSSYFLLYKASKKARYDLKRYTTMEAQKFHDDHFEEIRKHLKSLSIEWSVPAVSVAGGTSP